MYLKSLRMQGFKSFPDPTLIEFHEGITAIVGPNGSGKSNVTDAIRWVLGEQSAKTLRGSKMEDVIFNGTETRRQLGFAEVTITFDNADHNIPIEFDTVEVTRRYYRSGDSEYSINKVECRLKDIRELFMDTGIGRDGYSIIGQGKIDQILSENSEERRKVFDEAAGIVKFKLRKRDTERKLERTENNLIRINDILQELDLRVKPLAKQAKKLKEYHLLRDQMEQIDLALILHDVERNMVELENLQMSSRDLLADLKEAKKLADSYREEFQIYEKLLEKTDKEIDSLRIQEADTQANLAERSEQKAVLKERSRMLEFQLERDENQLKELEVSVSYLNKDLLKRDLENEKTESEISQLYEKYLSEQAEQKALDDKLVEFNQDINQLQKSLEDKKQIIISREQSRNQYQQEIKFILGQINDLQVQIEEEQSAFRKLNQEISHLKLAIEKSKEKFETSSQDLQKARQRVNEKREELTHLDDAHRESVNLLNNYKYRLRTLQELEQNLEGFHQTVKNVMRESEKNTEFGLGVHGPLASLIQVPEKYEKAIEVALGAAVNNIITDTRQDASRIIKWLKETKAGRETFLPLDGIDGRALPDHIRLNIEKMSGCLGVASEKLQYEPIYENVISQLLGHVLLAEDLKTALAISESLDRRYRVISLAGDVIQVGGSMTGGEFKKNSAGLLKRNREIEEYQKDILDLELLTDKQSKNIEEENKILLDLGQIQIELENKYLDEEKQIFYLESQLAGLEQQKINAEKDAQLKVESFEKLEERKTIAERHFSDENLNTTTVGSEIKNIEKELQNLIGEKAEIDQAIKEKQELLMASHIAFKTKEESYKSFLALKEQVEKDISQQKTNLDQLQVDLTRSKKALADLAEDEKNIEQNAEILHQDLIQLKEKITLKQEERNQIEKSQKQLFSKSEEQAELVSNLNVQVERLHNRNERLEQSILSSKNYIWETYEKTYVSLNREDYPLSEITESREKLKNLKNQIKNLGSINPNALEEYEEVAERFDFMTLQKEDIEKSIASLDGVIKELEAAMSKQFEENFAQINANFKEVFSALFIGGEAELALESEDTLNSGIQIKAQPPGKRLQSLNLLSGGERSLTAIALLLAIFKLRPAPFCVLDEVESALDESNIIRFTDYLKAYTDQSQFMLVTHRKGTMEAADRLYGITMKERGVSKVLSLELSDADNIKDIH